MSSPIDFPKLTLLEERSNRRLQGTICYLPLLHYLNGRPVSLHVRGARGLETTLGSQKNGQAYGLCG